ncbi:hypothetical protein FA13DRAFT_1352054 [Coprinellus micaceus]|uniref:Uncharacterized protein n=1 Tax=Coprinellus micaceus TaxID=71717 RepID=A0A4Y7TNL6_COPMI|nr:hypothetical protein FA13DRAFT_1352054 [Coprinellus micaceus]
MDRRKRKILPSAIRSGSFSRHLESFRYPTFLRKGQGRAKSTSGCYHSGEIPCALWKNMVHATWSSVPHVSILLPLAEHSTPMITAGLECLQVCFHQVLGGGGRAGSLTQARCCHLCPFISLSIRMPSWCLKVCPPVSQSSCTGARISEHILRAPLHHPPIFAYAITCYLGSTVLRIGGVFLLVRLIDFM